MPEGETSHLPGGLAGQPARRLAAGDVELAPEFPYTWRSAKQEGVGVTNNAHTIRMSQTKCSVLLTLSLLSSLE